MGAMLRRGAPVLLAVLGLVGSAAAAPDAIPVEDFFMVPELIGIRLSPDGQRLAGISPEDDAQAVVILDLETRRAHRVDLREPRILGPFFGRGERRLQRLWWGSEERLIASVGVRGDHLSYLLLIGRDGGGLAKVAHRPLRPGLYPEEDELLSRLPGSPRHVLMEFPRTRLKEDVGTEVRRLDLHSGDSETLQRAHPRVVRWLADPDGAVRAGLAVRGEQRLLFYRDGPEGPFQELETLGGVALDPLELQVLAVERGPRLVVASRHEGDRFAVYLYEMTERGFVGRLFGHPRVDVHGPLVKDWDETLLGIRYTDDFERIHWLDEEWRARQASIDARLPDRVNRIESWDRAGHRFVIHSEGDRHPPRWYLYEEGEGRLRTVSRGLVLPEETLADSRPVVVPARDGLELPAYLTLPRGAGGAPIPFVVEIFGGGFGRARRGFDADLQLLVSRGLGVLRLHPRGTAGFGRRLEVAGFGQWGRRALDDVDDAAAWLVSQGLAEPGRICTWGFGGFPGYAALMALARSPERYRCGAAWGPITDLEAFLGQLDRRSDEPLWRRRIGSGAALAGASPLARIADFRAPVLVGRGTQDRQVPPEHGRDFVKAMAAADKEAERFQFADDDHDLDRRESRVEFYRGLIGFLERALGPGEPAGEPKP